MTKEQDIFLSIVKDYIHGSKHEEYETTEWKKILEHSRSHQLTAIVYAQCRAIIPKDFAEEFRAVYLATISTNVKRRKISNTILTLLKECGVGCFTVKGNNIACYYPNWEYRTMGDTDIVVNDLEKAHSVLRGNGFQGISKTKDREYQYSIQNMEFELHDRMVYEEAINLDSTTVFLNNYQAYVFDDRLDESFHFIYILNHLRKHFMNSGVGFRQFVDVAVMVKNNTNIDWRWTEEKLKEIGLLSFAKTVFYYIDRWFGVVAPIASTEVSEDVFETSTDYIFDNGVFGFDNVANKDYLIANTVRNAKNHKLAMLKSAMQKLFPSYKAMIASKTYSFLVEKPILLPIAWIYRFAREIKNKGFSKGKKLILESFVSTQYIEKREEMFRSWGLE